jgi:hypothetical protein
MLFEGTCNMPVFNAWLAKAVCPLLNATQVMIMDNVPFHKSSHITALITGVGEQRN